MQETHRIQIPLSILKDIKCRHCQEFVSCGPVYVVPDGGILCGRCKSFAKLNFRNYAFEVLAKYFLYPCYNWSKHCDVKLAWNQCLDHEPKCKYNTCCSIFCSKPSKVCSSHRKLPERDEYHLHHIPFEMLEKLQCIHCQCYLSYINVYIGPNGENICHRCISNEGIPEFFLRNIAYEKLASLMIFPCIYRNRGCPMSLPFSKELCLHEMECSYGQIYQKLPKKVHPGDKERGVIMTHSGHYYGTITPNSALWAPTKTKNSNIAGVTKEYNEIMENVKNIKHHHRKETSIDSTTSSNNANRDNIVSNDFGQDNGTQSYNKIQRQLSNGSNNKQFSFYNQYQQQNENIRHSYNQEIRPQVHAIPRNINHNNFIGSVSNEDLTRPQNDEHLRHYNSNIIQEGNYNIYQIQPTVERNNSNASYRYPINYSPSVRSGNQPNREESFRVGNPEIIAELKNRNKLKVKQQRDESEMETVSIRSSDTLDSLNTVLTTGHQSNYSEVSEKF